MKFFLKTTVMACAMFSGAALAEDVGALLTAADQFRLASDEMQVETQITSYNRDGSKEKERRYLVFSQKKHQSLVLMQSPAEAGQKVLMLGDDFWMLLPGSQRPLRITPMQKLLGDASIGDIATMSWAQDYEGKLVAEEQCERVEQGLGQAAGNTQACLHLSLDATRKAAAYQHIDLWLGKTKHEPIKADLYVQSEKLAKRASFILDKSQVPAVVSEMVLLDQLSSHKETRVRYLSRKPRSIPEQWLNPMFLAKNPSLE
ncbi:outer membrane lipoprotein-sorting protein [Undibacterium sp. Ren11W]|uniref:outer membrane lipoprotein-sorting protein n=1 Tax=Undibacterium sp. Ren11W TaxID=3413045 RepID=UPI003BEF6E49